MNNKKLIRLTEADLNRIVKESANSIILEKHRPSGVSRRIHTRDANGNKQSFDYIPNLPKYNKNLDFKNASKFQRINARQVEDPNGEDIDTVLKDGTIERKGLHLPQGYYNVNNVGGQEHWGIDPKTFAKKYEPDPENDGVYKPKGGPMKASGRLNRNVAFQAPWGGRMDMKKGSRILQDPNNPNDTYGIGGDEFDSTYKFDESVNRDSKRLIKVTETDLHRIVKESVNRVLTEVRVKCADGRIRNLHGDDWQSWRHMADLRDKKANAASAAADLAAEMGYEPVEKQLNNIFVKNNINGRQDINNALELTGDEKRYYSSAKHRRPDGTRKWNINR